MYGEVAHNEVVMTFSQKNAILKPRGPLEPGEPGRNARQELVGQLQQLLLHGK